MSRREGHRRMPLLHCYYVTAAFAGLLFALSATPGFAQSNTDGRTTSPPVAIDIKVDTTPQDNQVEDCSPQQEDAAAISGEIVVCRRVTGSENRLYSKDDAQQRYAEETMNEGIIAAPDVAGAGIFRGPATVSGLCFVPPCPRPPAYMVDFSTIPEAPPGSDADRIARGLAPLGSRAEAPLDPPPAESEAPISDDETVSPPESASPAAEPSG
ncbi:hypothetical protein [Erythrobacter litoralis]|uniref:hypothetical protein n=1 Tax=Erythrobacter litoralis TaxID=39960 RepID=UPI00243519C8|nr:hypothetical protein [Erythrobacter litoralis]